MAYKWGDPNYLQSWDGPLSSALFGTVISMLSKVGRNLIPYKVGPLRSLQVEAYNFYK